jgi:signal transduction histidine kinase
VRRLPIRDRVTLAAALSLAAGLAILTLAVMLLLANRLDRDASSVLHARAGAVLTTLAVKNGRLHVREPPNDELLDRDAWVFDAGRAVERPEASAASQRAATAMASLAGTHTRTVGRTRLLSVPADGADGRPAGAVVVGVNLVPYLHTEHIALAGMLALDLFVLIAGALVARRAVGVALRPVADMTAKAAAWSDHDLDQRFDLGTPRDELTGLSATLDALLTRIGASIRHEQRFSAEVAHELNTPLSGMRAEAELALRAGADDSERRAALEQIIATSDRMAAVIATLLSTARTSTEHSPGSSDGSAALSSAVETITAQATARAIEIRVHVPDPSPLVAAEHDVVAQTLHPLLDNAVRHAHAHVDVTLEQRDALAVFSVHDDGPGVDPTLRAHVFEAGTSGHGSAGLGLPLARRLAHACAGDILLADAPDGACFELSMPAIEVTRSRTGS